jgi:hypothetical protein
MGGGDGWFETVRMERGMEEGSFENFQNSLRSLSRARDFLKSVDLASYAPICHTH